VSSLCHGFATGGLTLPFGLFNGWRLAERILLIFAPVLTSNGDHKAFVTAHAQFQSVAKCPKVFDDGHPTIKAGF
jgi:hypothetical protein